MMQPIARDWTIIRVYADEDNYGYRALYAPNGIDEDIVIELENGDGTTEVIYVDDFEVVAKMTEADADEFIGRPIAEQDQFLAVGSKS